MSESMLYRTALSALPLRAAQQPLFWISLAISLALAALAAIPANR
jgi:hypothetical protein